MLAFKRRSHFCYTSYRHFFTKGLVGMETALHRQLKLAYATSEAKTEVTVHGYRIDAIGKRGELIEIQHASLGALRDKTRCLLSEQTKRVRIVKPIIARKTLVTLDAPDGEVLRKRLSPKRGDVLDIFLDLVHFGNIFPHRKLILEVVLIEAEEIRIDRVRPSRRRGKRYKTLEQNLVGIESKFEFAKLSDLLALLPLGELPQPFDTAELAAAMGKARWFAQKVAYCLRLAGAVEFVGKRGNSQLYATKKSIAKVKRAA